MNLQISGLKVDAGAGPGSRGGKIIGHTSSGKPIYMTHGHPGHGDFTRKEHIEASNAHIILRSKSKEADRARHEQESKSHKTAADSAAVMARSPKREKPKKKSSKLRFTKKGELKQAGEE